MGIRKGFEELPHTADLSVRVWAGNLAELFEEAAVAFYSVAGCVIVSLHHVDHELSFEAQDNESLLVIFLSELNHMLSQGFQARKYQINVEKHRLHAYLEGVSGAMILKEVKAITYHNLAITEKPGRYEVTVVFDV